MTLLDFIKLGLIKTHTKAEQMAADLIDRWHDSLVAGELREVLGLTSREYQAWTTGHVSLLTIAEWRRSGPPPLDPAKPWFKRSGRPGTERVGYLEDRSGEARSRSSSRRRVKPKPR